MFKRLLGKIFLRIIPVEGIERLINDLHIRRCVAASTLGKGSKFYEDARVINLRGNRSLIEIGDGSHIRGELVTFAFGGQIIIGSNSYIGQGTIIRSAEKITIGNHVLISHNCNIIDTDSHEIDHIERARGFENLFKNGHSKIQGNILCAPIYIEDYAWISYNVSILKGVRIGRGAIVGAGSVVTKDVDSFTVVAGNPARVIKTLQGDRKVN